MTFLKNFIGEYKRSLILSLLLHLVLFCVLGFGMFNFTKTVKVTPVSGKKEQVVRAVTVDAKKVDALIKTIIKDENKQQQAKKRLTNEIRKAKKAKLNEEKKLKEARKKISDLKKQEKSLKASRKKEIAKLKAENKQEEAKLAKLKQQTKDLSKNIQVSNEQAVQEKKKQIENDELKNKENQKNSTIVATYTNLILSAIDQEFIVNAEHIKNMLYCKVKITLNLKGEVLNVQLIKSSGNSYFDRNALNAVKKASPLPVPESTKNFKTFAEFMLTLRPTKVTS